ncbi:hypothetical protein Tco_0225435, partial [Tanacetum coccineum]
LLTVPVSVIPESSIASSTTITSLLSSLFPNIQQSTPIPTPITTKETTPTTVVPNSKTLSQPKPYKSVVDIRKIKIKQAEKQQEPKYTIVSSNMDALREFDQKRTLFETMKSFEQNSKHKALYKGVADKLKKRKPDDDRDEGHLVGPD